MQKSRVFSYSYSGTWDIFHSKAVKEWIASPFCNYNENPEFYKATKSIMSKTIEEHKITFYELYERIKTIDDPEIDDNYRNFLITELEKIEKEIKEGDFIDIDDEYMHGFFYFDGNNFMQTTGLDCKNIPEQAFKFVELYGTQYFEDLPANPHVKVPKSIKVVKVNRDDYAEANIVDGQTIIQIKNSATEDNHSGYYLINNKKYYF